MGAVQDEDGIPAQHLEATGPAYGGQTFPDVRLGYVPAPAPQQLRRGDGQGGIPGLVGPRQGDEEVLICAVIEAAALQTGTQVPQLREVRSDKGAAFFGAAGFDHRFRFFAAAVAGDGAAGLDDPGLHPGDLSRGIPQGPGVVQADGADHGGFRGGDHVGGVPFAAHAHLQHGDIAAHMGEPPDGQGGLHLKLGGGVVHGLCDGAYDLDRLQQVRIGNILPVHLNPLVPAHHVGRGVEPGLIPGSGQNGGETGADASLAVGSRHMDEFQLPFRIPQGVQQSLSPGETGLETLETFLGEKFKRGHAHRGSPPYAPSIVRLARTAWSGREARSAPYR